MQTTTERPTPQELASDPENLDFARRLAMKRSLSIGHPELLDDFYSAALLGLFEAALSYDPDRIGRRGTPVEFRSYAYPRIWGAMVDELRKIGRFGFVVNRGAAARGEVPAPLPLSTDVGKAEYEGVELAERIVSDDLPVGWEAEQEDEFEGLARKLTPRQGDVIRAMYQWADTRRMKDAGAFLGISESRVSQLHSQALDELSRLVRRPA